MYLNELQRRCAAGLKKGLSANAMLVQRTGKETDRSRLRYRKDLQMSPNGIVTK